MFSVALSRVYLAKLPAQLDPPLHVIPHAQRLVGARGYLRAFVITGSRIPLPSAIMRVLLLHEAKSCVLASTGADEYHVQHARFEQACSSQPSQSKASRAVCCCLSWGLREWYGAKLRASGKVQPLTHCQGPPDAHVRAEDVSHVHRRQDGLERALPGLQPHTSQASTQPCRDDEQNMRMQQPRMLLGVPGVGLKGDCLSS